MPWLVRVLLVGTSGYVSELDREEGHITKLVAERVSDHAIYARARLVHRTQFVVDAARATRELRHLER
jgi:hypothetical protein